MWSIFSRNSAASLPFEMLDLVTADDRSIWKLHKGKRKSDGEEVSIFVCEGSSTAAIDSAKIAVKRLKMLKHPSVLSYLDSLELDNAVYLVTEAVTPLLQWLSSNKRDSSYANVVSWGIFQVIRGIGFLNNEGQLLHNNMHSGSIFITAAGDWKISGLEYSTNDLHGTPKQVLQSLAVYTPPGLHSAKQKNIWSNDCWYLGCLIWEIFYGPLQSSGQLQQKSEIPKSLQPTYYKLLSSEPLTRPNPKIILDKLRKPKRYFSNNLIDTLLALERIQIMSDSDINRFFVDLPTKLDDIPEFICKNKVLPALIKAYEFSNAGSIILVSLFKIGQTLEDDIYQSQIIPCIVKMFSSNDRSTRLKLLQQMENLSPHLDSKTINDQIYTHLQSGFDDTNPAIRENTVKAVLHIAPQLNHHNLNTEILKHFAKLQSRDDQGGIRTNTTVCLGKVASYLHPDTRQKCLVSAFTRAMKDPFPPARIAGVTALAATQQYYPLADVASKVIPSLSFLTMDPDKAVRDAVFGALKGFVSKLEKVSDNPDLKEVMEKEVVTAGASATSAAHWAGWAVGALASKFYKGSSTQSKLEPQNGPSTDSGSGPGSSSVPGPGSGSSSVPGSVPGPGCGSGSGSGSGSATESTRSSNSPSPRLQKASLSPSEAFAEMTVADPEGPIDDGWEDESWGLLEDASESHLVLCANKEETKNETPVDRTQMDSFLVAASEVKTEAWSDDWNDRSNEDPTPISTKDEEARKIREERKIQRLEEIKAKRTARTGPMKLGAKKL